MSAGLWVKLDANFFDDDAIMEVDPLAQLIYIRMLCLAKRTETDGFVSYRHLDKECADITDLGRYLEQLVVVRLIDEDQMQRGWKIYSWLKWNKSKADIEELREKRRRDGEAAARKRWQQDSA